MCSSDLDTFKDLGPLGVVLGNLAVPGLGTALGVITAIDEGADIGDIAKNVAIGEIVNQTGIGGSVADTVGSSLAGELAQNTVKGLLSGQDLDTALTNAAVNTGVSTVAGELTNQTPEDFQTDVETVLDSTAGVPVSELQADINQVLDMPISTPPAEQIMVTETPPDLTPAPTLDEIVAELEAGSLGSLSDLPEPIPESTPELVSGMDLAADATPGNTLADVELEAPATLTKAQVEEMIKLGLAATAATAAADQLTSQSESPGFDIVPVPTDWKSPVYDQSYVPIDLNTIFNNERVNWKPRPSIMGGAYMGSPVSINDIVNQIIGAELMPQAMPTNITNAVGGILGSTTTR